MGKRPLAVFAIRQLSRITGAVRNVLEQAGYVSRLGYDVHICAERVDPTHPTQYGFQWIPVPRFPIRGYASRLCFDWYIQRYIRRTRPDLFISHGFACSDDILVIHNCHALCHECLNGSAPRYDEAVRFQSRVIRKSRFRFLITNSELMKRDLTKRYGLDPLKVGVFYQGVDTRQFNSRNHLALRRQGRGMLELPEQAYVAGLITSGFFKKRNVRFFLEVAAKVRKLLPESCFLVAGKDGKVQWYKDYAKQMGLKDAVVFAPPLKEVQIYYHALDAFVFPAKIEEFGRVVLEALACGIPAIIGSAVGAAEIMEKERVPTIVEGWDPQRWAEEIVSLARNPAQAQAHANSGIILAEKYAQPERARAMEELLARLLRPNGSP